MDVAKLKVDRTFASAVSRGIITAGLAGATISVEYAPGIWDGLTKTVVFKGSATKDVVTNETTIEIPWEVLTEPNRRLSVGFFGMDNERQLVIPTVWADLGLIQPGADPSGDPSTDPSLPVWGQIASRVEEIAKDVKDLQQTSGGGSGGASAYYVTVTGANGEYTSDKTTEELTEAYENGHVISCIFTASEGDFFAENLIMPMLMYQDGMAIFGTYIDGVSWMVVHTYPTIQAVPRKMAAYDDIPSALPNPGKLIFRGAVTEEYNGMRDVTINIPDSGGNVAYDEAQNLTDEQKAQARENIGAQPAGNYLTEVPEGYAKKTDIPSLDGYAKSEDIPTDEHINSLINTALGVIENGTY